MTVGASATEYLTDHTRAERERLAELLDGLSAEQWDLPSLCERWRVREVAAHLTMPFRIGVPRLIAGIVGAGLSFDRFADHDARRTARARAEQELVALLRANIDHPWSPPGGGAAQALSHDVIHGLDFTEPLGLPCAPADRIAVVLSATSERELRYFGTDLQDRRLVATDADAVVGGGGTAVELTAKDVLLVVTGRRALSEVAP